MKSINLIGEPIIDLLKKIDEHAQYLSETGLMDKRRRDIIEMRVIKNAEDIVRQKFKGKRKSSIARDVYPLRIRKDKNGLRLFSLIIP